VLQCNGGVVLAPGSTIPTTSLTVYYGAPITSRLLTTINGVAAGVNASEAMLLIDEPNNGALGSQTGYGPSLPQMLCNFPAAGAGPTGCQQYVSPTGVPTTTVGANIPAANVFSGVVNGSSVTFNGIPVLPPVTSGNTRVYRITNVRINANSLYGGVAGSYQQIFASIGVTGGTASFLIANPTPLVGYLSKGLNASASNTANFPQCNNQNAFADLVNFNEGFDSAFKTRVDGVKGGVANNYGAAGIQNIPGIGYNSESNFVFNGANGNAVIGNGPYIAGYADYGTRLKATFTNIPVGATLYVSTSNVISGNNNAANLTQVFAPTPANTTSTSYAVLLSGGTEGLNFSAAQYTNTYTSPSSSGFPSTVIQYVPFTSSGAPIVAVWEVLNTQPTVTESLSFAVYVQYTAATNFPPVGNSSVALSFAPNSTNGAFNATHGGDGTNAGSSVVNYPIPRFIDSGISATAFTVSQCQTILLFPYVTTATGFTTGISIANTTVDPLKTVAQQGLCKMYWYNTVANVAATPILTDSSMGTGASPVIAAGVTYTLDASAPPAGPGLNFNGYMIANCAFQFAHGFAVVQDVGAQHIISVYLALVVPTPGSGGTRTANNNAPESLGN
jgi:hypothetical protein